MKTFNNLLVPGRAKFFPALTPNIARAAVVPHGGDRWNNRMVARSQNFFEQYGTYFHYPCGLISAGVVLGKNQTLTPGPLMTDPAHRSADCSLIVDSGGYSIKKGHMNFHGDPTRASVLDYTINNKPDAAITLDYPPLVVPRAGYPDYNGCRDITAENLAFIVRHCPAHLLGMFLCALQGESEGMADDWYKTMKQFPFRNWAFAGLRYKGLPALLRQLVIMYHDGMLDETTWIHALGGYRLPLACALTTIRETLVELLDRSINVTFDNSFIFNQVNEYGQCVRAFNLTKRGFSISFAKLPDEPKYVGSSMPFPYSGISEISKGLTIGDLCVNRYPTKTSTWDDMSYLIVENHNVDVYLTALEAAHARYLLPPAEAREVCPAWLVRTREGIRRVLMSGEIDMIDRYRADFDMLTKNIDPLTADDFR